MCFVFIFTHILDWQTLLMLLFSAAVKVSIIILLFLHFFSLKKNDINAISPSHFPSIPLSFHLHHHHLSTIIIMLPLFRLHHHHHATIISPQSPLFHHYFDSIIIPSL